MFTNNKYNLRYREEFYSFYEHENVGKCISLLNFLDVYNILVVHSSTINNLQEKFI